MGVVRGRVGGLSRPWRSVPPRHMEEPPLWGREKLPIWVEKFGSDPQKGLLTVQEVQEGPLDKDEADPPQHALGRLAER